jgi:hypothetical protein
MPEFRRTRVKTSMTLIDCIGYFKTKNNNTIKLSRPKTLEKHLFG